MNGRIYSVGYEGFDVDGLVERLVASKVSAVIDRRLKCIEPPPGLLAEGAEHRTRAGRDQLPP